MCNVALNFVVSFKTPRAVPNVYYKKTYYAQLRFTSSPLYRLSPRKRERVNKNTAALI